MKSDGYCLIVANIYFAAVLSRTELGGWFAVGLGIFYLIAAVWLMLWRFHIKEKHYGIDGD